MVINAPWVFTAIWKLIQPWLDERTARKVRTQVGVLRFRFSFSFFFRC